MATISLHLRDRKATSPTPIFMLLYADGVQTKIKTGLRVHPGQWDVEGQKAKTRGRGVETKANGELNDDLAGMKERALEYYGQQRRQGTIPTSAEVWQAIKPVRANKEADKTMEPDELSGRRPLVDFAEYIERSKAKNSAGTAASKNNTLWHLTTFSQTLQKPLGYEEFTLAFKDKFGDFLVALPMSDNTVAK